MYVLSDADLDDHVVLDHRVDAVVLLIRRHGQVLTVDADDAELTASTLSIPAGLVG
jgi:hypothetical protein